MQNLSDGRRVMPDFRQSEGIVRHHKFVRCHDFLTCYEAHWAVWKPGLAKCMNFHKMNTRSNALACWLVVEYCSVARLFQPCYGRCSNCPLLRTDIQKQSLPALLTELFFQTPMPISNLGLLTRLPV